MKQPRRAYLGGLEVDTGQPGLHYARSGVDLPIVYGKHPPNPSPRELEKRRARTKGQDEAQQTAKKRLRGMTIRMSAALAVSIVCAIIAASMAVSLAYKLEPISQIASFQSNSTHKNSSSSCIPTSSCRSLISPFHSIDSTSYTVHCNTDYLGNYLLAVYVYAFEDCIHACSSYSKKTDQHATPCGGVVYSWTTLAGTNAANENDSGNCFLKPSDLDRSKYGLNFGVDSAIVV